ncbi:MAG: type II secretion system F family protein [Acidimicrobiales bacterium]
MSLFGAGSGALLGVGIALLAFAFLKRPPRPPRRLPRVPWRRLAPAIGAAVVVGVVTGWPVGAGLAGLGVGFLPALVGPGPEVRAAARSEAVAAWTEMLCDTLAASAGLIGAVLASADRAPLAIRPQVQALAGRMRARMGLEEALRAFAAEVADPSADLVVAALILSARGQAARLGDVLGALATSVREEVAMRGRIHSSRARVRSGVRVVAGFSVGFGLLLLVVAHSYLAPFGSPTGEVVLAIVGGLYAAGLGLMVHMARPHLATRLLGGPR